jgi:hypothetical protein
MDGVTQEEGTPAPNALGANKHVIATSYLGRSTNPIVDFRAIARNSTLCLRKRRSGRPALICLADASCIAVRVGSVFPSDSKTPESALSIEVTLTLAICHGESMPGRLVMKLLCLQAENEK